MKSPAFFLRLFFIAIALTITGAAVGQNITQSIRGQVVDKQSLTPLPGVNVILVGSAESGQLIGAATDLDGYFELAEVPIGRVSLQFSMIGYETTNLSNLSLTANKQLVLKVELEEALVSTGEVEIRATQDKSRTINEMATTSTRTFSIEESQRFAGARNDVSRMAANFAGVRGSNDAVNDIVIRGNSPLGLLWRFEGVDIPNPNHFGDFGSTGGPVSMLNNNVLSNSDFMTGAFPAEYGNAISGVFDLKMRNGNDQKHEFLGQIGFNGFEFGAEGPISKKDRSSYLVNYRYSTLGVMDALNIDIGTGAAVPQYQDLSFKLNFPSSKRGTVSVFGLAGNSSIDIIASDRDTTQDEDNLYTNNDIDVYLKTRTAVVGASHTYLWNNSTYSKITLAGTSISNKNIVDSVSLTDLSVYDFFRSNLENNKLFANFYIQKKINARHNFRVGGFVNRLGMELLDSLYISAADRFEIQTRFDGNTWLLQPYAQWQWRPAENVTVNGGVSGQYLALNDNYSIEPRLGVKWQFSPLQSLSAAYGLHSQMAPLVTYFQQVRLSDGSYVTPNKDLDFTKSHHFVLGYDWNFSETMRLKVETYYQQIYDAIVEVQPSSFSILNAGSFSTGTPDSLTNGGEGQNYGVELTLEKFMDKGLYFLLTTSLYESRYEGSDGVERRTAFDGNYVANLLGGKEFRIKSKKEEVKFKKLWSIDAKVTAAGGQRYTPVDVEASIQNGESEYIDDEAFSLKFRDYFRADIRFAYRMDGKKYSQEWALDIQNITNRENPYFQRFNPSNGEVETVNQLGLFPIVQYRIEF